jgi:hypothetical protein
MAAWFKPKRYGLGAAPSSWQGWALTLAYIAAVMTLGIWFGAGEDQIAERATPFIFITLTLTIIFVGIAWRTTEGGWRWRWGDKD